MPNPPTTPDPRMATPPQRQIPTPTPAPTPPPPNNPESQRDRLHRTRASPNANGAPHTCLGQRPRSRTHQSPKPCRGAPSDPRATKGQTSSHRSGERTERGHSCPRPRTTKGQTISHRPGKRTERGHSCPRPRATEGQTSSRLSVRRASAWGHYAGWKTRAPFVLHEDDADWKVRAPFPPQRAAEKDSIESATMAARRRLRSFSGLPIDSMASRSPAGTGPKRRSRASRTSR